MSYPDFSSIAESVYYFATRRHLLEGRYDVDRGVYGNWDRSYTARPLHYLTPESEEDLCRAVAEAERIGFVGAGHSFNDLHLQRPTLLSLDRYKGLLALDVRAKTATFCAGQRIREVTRFLQMHGLAMEVLPDHNAQSLAGVLATDVHGSGVPAHISESVLSLKLIDARGVVHETKPGERLFRATVGGMGCTGLIIEVTLRCVPCFRLETQSYRCSFEQLLTDLDQLIDEHDHMAVGYLPAIDACVVELKDRTGAPATPFGPIRETTRDVLEAIAQALALPLTTSTSSWLREIGKEMLALPTGHLRRETHLILESAEGYNRNVYHVHKQVEFSCPRENAREVLCRGRALMKQRPREHYYLLGLRATRRHGETLVGPAAGAPQGADKTREDIVWIAPHLFGNRTDQGDERAWRELVEAYRGLPHYGKNLLGLDADYLARVHGQRWTDYLTEVRKMDPHGKFANALTERGGSGHRKEFGTAAE